jgi:hypothetical protein
VWRGAEGPVATCVPRDGSNLVEWRHNLVGDIRGGGAINDDLVVSHSTSLFENGFITYGEADCKSEFFMEGHPNEVYARKKIAYAALPDGKTTLTLQIAIAKRRTYIDSIKGLHLNIPNDIYNGMSRTYYTDQGVFEVKNAVNIEGLQRLYVEGLGIVALNGSLTLFHPAERQVEITKRACHDTRDSGGILWCDEILTVKRVEKMWVEKDEILYDDVIALICGSEDDTINLQRHARPVHLGPDIRAAVARGADKKDYIMLFNISQSEKEVQIDSGNPDHYLIDLASLENVHSKDNSFYIRVPASTAKIYCCAGIGE